MKKYISILQTDVLPYELPLFFSNEILINFVLNISSEDINKYENTLFYLKDTVPLNFYIYKNNEKKRILSLPHPYSQLNMLFFLKNNSFELLNYFSFNRVYSLRIPYKINKLTYSDLSLKDLTVDNLKDGKEIKHDKEKYFNFFDVGKYSSLSNFNKSNYAKTLEKKYIYLQKLDLKKCFYSIYTHSIDWAYLGSKEAGKLNKYLENRTSARLDKLMMKANHGETNGIIVGPEFSRIVAEVVLSKIDTLLFTKLKKEKLYIKKDYEITRYIDDFYIFSNSKETLQKITSILESILDQFKLSFNESKSSIDQRPFFKETFWIYQLKSAIKKFFSNFQEENNLIGIDDTNIYLKTRRIDSFYFNLLSELKDLLSKYPGQDYKIVSYFISSLQTKQFDFSKFKIKDELLFKNISNVIDINSIALSYSFTVNNIYKYCSFISEIRNLDLNNELKNNLNLIIFDKAVEAIECNQHKQYECLILISYMKYLNFNINQNLLSKFINNDSNYFEIISILFYLNTNSRKANGYINLFKQISKILEYKISEWDFTYTDISNIIYSDNIFLINDLVLCNEFNNTKFVNQSISNIKLKFKDILKENSIYKEIFKNQLTFTNWNKPENEFIKQIKLKQILSY